MQTSKSTTCDTVVLFPVDPWRLLRRGKEQEWFHPKPGGISPRFVRYQSQKYKKWWFLPGAFSVFQIIQSIKCNRASSSSSGGPLQLQNPWHTMCNKQDFPPEEALAAIHKSSVALEKFRRTVSKQRVVVLPCFPYSSPKTAFLVFSSIPSTTFKLPSISLLRTSHKTSASQERILSGV